MNDQEILNQVETEYLANLKNLELKNPRLIILFSGPPGSGKTTTAKAIEEKFGALRVASDDARKTIYTKYPDMPLDEINRLVLIFMSEILPKIEARTSNGLLIADASIDRNYDLVKKFADRYGYKTMTLAIQLSDEEHEKRIRERGPHPFASLEEILSFTDQRREEQQLFLSQHTPDMVVNADTPITEVINTIKKHLS